MRYSSYFRLRLRFVFFSLFVFVNSIENNGQARSRFENMWAKSLFLFERFKYMLRKVKVRICKKNVFTYLYLRPCSSNEKLVFFARSAINPNEIERFSSDV